MKKYVLLLFFCTCLLPQAQLRANEGMWLPILLSELNEEEMRAMGFELTAEDLYSASKSSLKDAVVRFGRGCTGEVVSGEGLVFTNHHCGYGSIQSLSSVENDYLTNGFWAKARAGELPVPGLTVTFIARIEQVTAQVLQGVTSDMDEVARQANVAKNIALLEAQTVSGTHYKAQIRPFFYGTEYFMFVTETFTDIRLVGAPPSSIGKFGGDTDNWMWPRHTGDFAVFRIYANKENKPAVFADDNVPYQPRHFFPIDLRGVNEGDFTFIYGFPGSTQQYLHSSAVDYVYRVANPAKIAIREQSLAIMDAAMKSSDEVRIQYAARYAGISNYYKKWQGENNGLKKLDAVNQKKTLEEEYVKRANRSDATRKYAQLVGQFRDLYAKQEQLALAHEYFRELVYYGPEVLLFAYNFLGLADRYEDLKAEGRLVTTQEQLKSSIGAHFKDYHAPTDQKLLAALLKIYLETIAPELHPEVAKTIQEKFKGDYEAYAASVFGKSAIVDKESAMAMANSFSAADAKKLRKDPAYSLMKDIFLTYETKVLPAYQAYSDQIEGLMRDYVAGMRLLFPERKFWPDANSTLRVSYGKAEGSAPRDGMRYQLYTTLEGVMEKYQPGDEEFDLPEKLLALYEAKDYGRYGKDGELVVCFTASNHTTGGNSGSPALNGKGHLIGINFDRSWESTMSDIMFDPERCRNIMVDIRYVLFVIDKVAGAGYLLDEMKLVE